MFIFSQPVMDALRELDVVIDMNDPMFKEDFDTMVQNNWEREQKKRSFRRDFKTVRWHTAMGMCCEKALESTGYFKSTAKITAGAVGISYKKRKTDLKCEGVICEAKSMYHSTDYFRFNDSQMQSILDCQPFNRLFVIVSREQIGNKYDVVFRCIPKYMVDAKHIHEYIKLSDKTEDWLKNEFDHKSAIKNDHCVAIR